MSDDELPVLESAESSATQRTGLMWLALVIPVVAGVALCFAPTLDVGYGISIASVIVSAALVAIDAHRLGPVDLKGKTRESPWLLFGGMCALWIAVYPIAFFRRRQFGGPQLGYFSLGSVVAFMGTPLIYSVVMPRPLPACTAAETVKLLEQIVRTTSLGPILTTIDNHREVGFDPAAQLRNCECVVHTTTGDINGKYLVEWQDQKAGMFQIRIPASELPACNSPEVINVLVKVIRSTPSGAQIKSIDGYQELSYDAAAGRRRGACVIHMDSGDHPIEFQVEWQNQSQAQFLVRLLTLED